MRLTTLVWASFLPAAMCAAWPNIGADPRNSRARSLATPLAADTPAAVSAALLAPTTVEEATCALEPNLSINLVFSSVGSLNGSPLIDSSGRVIVTGANRIASVWRDLSAVAWTAAAPSSGGYAHAALGPDDQVVAVTTTGIEAYSASGTFLWRTSDTIGAMEFKSPVVDASGNVYAVCQTDKTVRSFSMADGTQRWASTAISTTGFIHAPSLAGGEVFVSGNDGRLAALDASNGAVKWTDQLQAGVNMGATSPSPDGTFVVVASANYVQAVNVDPTHTQRWKYDLTSLFSNCYPAFDSDGNVHVAGYNEQAMKLNGATGAQMWRVSITVGSGSKSPDKGGVIDSDSTTVFYALNNGRLLGLWIADGSLRYDFSAGGSFYTQIALHNDGSAYMVQGSSLIARPIDYTVGIHMIGSGTYMPTDDYVSLYVLRRGINTGASFTVDVVFHDVTAQGGGVDYVSTTITATFTPGMSKYPVRVPITNRPYPDPLERSPVTFAARLENLSPLYPAANGGKYACAKRSVTVTIAFGRVAGGLANSTWPRSGGDVRGSGMYRGGLGFLSPEPRYDKPWTVTPLLGQAIAARPIIAADHTVVVVTTAGHVAGLSPSDGSTRWSTNLGSAISKEPCLGEHPALYVVLTAGSLVSVDVTTGVVLWTYTPAGVLEASSSCAVDEQGRPGVVMNTGGLWKLHLVRTDGAGVAWATSVSHKTEGSPVFTADGYVTVAGSGGLVQRMRVSDGSVDKSTLHSESFQSTPSIDYSRDVIFNGDAMGDGFCAEYQSFTCCENHPDNFLPDDDPFGKVPFLVAAGVACGRQPVSSALFCALPDKEFSGNLFIDTTPFVDSSEQELSLRTGVAGKPWQGKDNAHLVYPNSADVQALRISDGTPLYSIPVDAIIAQAVSFGNGGNLYVGTASGSVYCIVSGFVVGLDSAAMSFAEAGGPVSINVVRSGQDTASAFSVQVSFTDGTAIHMVDYLVLGGQTQTVSFAAGETSKSIPVHFNEDGGGWELDEYFTVRLSALAAPGTALTAGLSATLSEAKVTITEAALVVAPTFAIVESPADTVAHVVFQTVGTNMRFATLPASAYECTIVTTTSGVGTVSTGAAVIDSLTPNRATCLVTYIGPHQNVSSAFGITIAAAPSGSVPQLTVDTSSIGGGHARVRFTRRLVAVHPGQIVPGVDTVLTLTGGGFASTSLFACNLTDSTVAIATLPRPVAFSSSATRLSSTGVVCSFTASSMAVFGTNTTLTVTLAEVHQSPSGLGALTAPENLVPSAAPLIVAVRRVEPTPMWQAPTVSASTFALDGTLTVTWVPPGLSVSGGHPVALYRVSRVVIDGNGGRVVDNGTVAAAAALGPTTTIFRDNSAAENATVTYTVGYSTVLGSAGNSPASVSLRTPFRLPAVTAVFPTAVPAAAAGGVAVTVYGNFFARDAEEALGVRIRFSVSAGNVVVVGMDDPAGEVGAQLVNRADGYVVANVPSSLHQRLTNFSSTSMATPVPDPAFAAATVHVRSVHGVSLPAPPFSNLVFVPRPIVTDAFPAQVGRRDSLAAAVNITVSGAHFSAGCSVATAGVPCAPVTIVSASQLICTVGPAPWPGPSGPVVVTTPVGGESFSTDWNPVPGVTPAAWGGVMFSFTHPTVTSIIPDSAGVEGGTLVLIVGTHLGNLSSDIVSVTLGGVPCVSPTIVGGPETTGAAAGPKSSLTCITGGSNVAIDRGAVVVETVGGGSSDGGVPDPAGVTFTYVDGALSPPPTISSVFPELQPLSGGFNVTVMGVQFEPQVEITVTLRPVESGQTSTAATTTSPSSTSTRTHTLQQSLDLTVVRIPAQNVSMIPGSITGFAGLVFPSPPSGSSTGRYGDVTVRNAVSKKETVAERALYFVDFCREEGFFGVDVNCKPCPKGAFCPGGNRVWPIEGYWNPGEQSGFVTECVPRERCVGGRASVCAEGYEGVECSQCVDGYTRLQGGLCVLCPEDSGVMIYIIADVVLWSMVSLVAWFVRDGESFQRATEAVNILQDSARFSTLLSADMPKWMLQTYDVIKLVLGDYKVLKTDCLGERPAFLLEFLSTLAHSVLILLLMVVGLVIVGWVRTSLARGPDAKRAMAGFYADRRVRAFTVWAQLAYFTLASTAIGGIACARNASGQLRLLSDPSITCFTGPHIAAFIVSVAILAGGVIGWPLIYWWRVRRGLGGDDRRLVSEGPAREIFEHRWGSHFVLLKPQRRNHFLISYISMVVVATCSLLLTARPLVRLGIAGGFLLAYMVCVAVRRPHVEPRDDYLVIAIELPVMLLIVVGSLAQHGTLTGDSLRRASLATISLLLIALAAYTVDLVSHWVSPHKKGERGSEKPEGDRAGEVEIVDFSNSGGTDTGGRGGNIGYGHDYGGGNGEREYGSGRGDGRTEYETRSLSLVTPSSTGRSSSAPLWFSPRQPYGQGDDHRRHAGGTSDYDDYGFSDYDNDSNGAGNDRVYGRNGDGGSNVSPYYSDYY